MTTGTIVWHADQPFRALTGGPVENRAILAGVAKIDGVKGVISPFTAARRETSKR